MECQGACEQHLGDVAFCRVSHVDWRRPFYYYYCETAREKDRSFGFTVEITNPQKVKEELKTNKTTVTT